MSGGSPTISTTDVRLGGLKIQNTGYGVAIPIVYGSNRISPNLIEYTNFIATPHTTTQSAGGKGGGGGTSSNTTYTYSAAVIFGLCEGPVQGFGQLWVDKNTYTTPAKRALSLFAGSYSQVPWTWMQTYHPERAIGYQGIAYVACANYDLGGQASIGNHTFEVVGFGARQNGYDVNVMDVIADFLGNANYGAMFPYLGNIAAAWNYCQANGLFISPVIDTQKPAHEWLKQLASIANIGLVWSDGILKAIPYGDQTISGNGATYTPSITPIYDLNDDDFLETGGDPVTVTRKRQADAFNAAQVEYLNRNNQYNIEPADVRDQANVEAYGLRSMQPIKLHEVCVPAVAKLVAQTILQRALYIRNEYTFALSWKYCLLEPMDVVTLTDAALGLNKTPVRITSVEENYDGMLTLTAEEMPFGVSQPAQYPHVGGVGYQTNFNSAPGAINDAVIFEAPNLLTVSGLEVWIATSGQSGWGGCEVWVSRDNATYMRVGEINGGARHGFLTAQLALNADPDITDTLSVDISASGGQLTGGTRADADAYNTLCYVDGEFVSFQSATLTATGKYDLGTRLRRGAYGSKISTHNAGTRFARIDKAIFKYAFTMDMIGTPLYIKLLSFNQYRGAIQTLSDVSPITYNVTGYALNSPLPSVANLSSAYRNNRVVLQWDAVSDFRTVDYEIRRGAAWNTAMVLGRTPLLEFQSGQDDTYWVAAHYGNGVGINAYSSVPSAIVVSGSMLPSNVLANFDEGATSWVGAFSGGAFYDKQEAAVKLVGAGDVMLIPSFIDEPSIEYYGGVASSGSYQIPAGHEVDIGIAQSCNCSVAFKASSDNPYVDFMLEANVLAMASWIGEYAGKSSVAVQIDTALNSGVWQGWRDFVPGQYVARKFRFRILFATADATVTALLSSFSFVVDVPDRLDTGTAISIPSGGQAITFSTPFHAVPNVQITILNAQAGDDAVFTVLPTINGFTVQVLNGGAGIVRTINWFAKGY